MTQVEFKFGSNQLEFNSGSYHTNVSQDHLYFYNRETISDLHVCFYFQQNTLRYTQTLVIDYFLFSGFRNGREFESQCPSHALHE